MHRSEPSRLQALALQLADKVNNFVDSNERIFEMKQGLYSDTVKTTFTICYGILFLLLIFCYNLFTV